TLVVTSVIGGGAEAIRNPPCGCGERTGSVVVGVQHREAVGGQVGDKLGENFLHSLDVFEVVRMVELDVGHDRAFRVMQDQAAVRFVDLGDEPLRATSASTGTVADH